MAKSRARQPMEAAKELDYKERVARMRPGSSDALRRKEFLRDPEASEYAGARIARGLRGGMTVTLSGGLGVGKTTMVRGMLRGLGWTGPVKSPSYVLVEHYAISSLYLYHFDFYRFDNAEEWDSTGFA